jgi:hypothetical protein
MDKSESREMEVEVTREITFKVIVTVKEEDDDDGCGGPSSTGNSMTGYRGSYFVANDYYIDLDSVLDAAKASVTIDDDEITESVNNLST